MSKTHGIARGRDVKKMEKPYTGREVVHTCSNGWTIEKVIPDEFEMEGFFMGHCLSPISCGVSPENVFSLREPDGTPHATAILKEYGERNLDEGWEEDPRWEFVGRCNQPPKDEYRRLLEECDIFGPL